MMYILAGEELGDVPPHTPWRAILDRHSKPQYLRFLNLDRFDLNKASLTPRLMEMVTHLAKHVQASWKTMHPIGIIRLIGHTDSTGNQEYNVRLGNQRAQDVKAILEKLLKDDILKGRIAVLVEESPGELQSIADNSTPDGRALNRRVEVFVAPFEPRTEATKEPERKVNKPPAPSARKSAAKLRVGTYWANDFTRGSCSADDPLRYSDDIARGFAKAMSSRGHQWTVDHGSSRASPTDWLSYPDAKGIPYDDSEARRGADTVDFAYLVSHGGLTFVDKPAPTEDIYVFRAGFGQDAPSLPGDAFRVEKNSQLQYPRCIWLNNKSKLGDKRLRWLVVDACESLQLPGYVKGLKMNLDVNPAKTWQHAFHGLNMVMGFTGYSTDGWWIDDRGWDFGRRAGAGEKLADAWVDEAYSFWTNDFPVAMACGRTETEAVDRLRNDRVTDPRAQISHNEIKWFAWTSRS